jgi:hypothetical protein
LPSPPPSSSSSSFFSSPTNCKRDKVFLIKKLDQWRREIYLFAC